MKVRNKNNTWTGLSDNFNLHGLGEVIVTFDDGSGTESMFINELDIFLPSLGMWKDMEQAFKDKDIIPDNYNTIFAEPKCDKDRENGYF